MSRPSFNQLPLRKGDPPYSAWGLYRLDDQLGTLNLLIPEAVKEAISEVKMGIRIRFDNPVAMGWLSTLRDQKEKRLYNGVTAKEISGPNATSTLVMHYEIKQGDILIMRSGFNVEWSKAKPTRWVGLEASLGMARLLWDSGFSAAAGDAPGFERFPFGGEFEGEKLNLHEILLSGWSMLIDEMFNVEDLSDEYDRQGRYSLFLTSMPMHVPGLVGIPPHAITIF
ncbi:uncharacterized protein BDZ99DRAFT_485982 [Mytilinidion resinicola]|uniref:Cyclase n=1 Tax=Mytilinidion resinicola TaxID=574789 RepID=A0A6A6Z0Z6_9PEZI|nr:uncharacterized protein BDZ99DRAFT_485982 [Mytilinidion resinicola]KAF2813897.1 hypothetical protein BDZ99DRAFT_485982 [Mytilinidion resinicola]